MTWNEVIELSKNYKGHLYGIDMNLRISFNRVFRESMKKHNLSQISLARSLNKTPVTVNNWANCRNCPNLKTITELKTYFESLETQES